MFNIFNIFKKAKPEVKETGEVQGTQNDVNDMKDGLPLVNEGLLSEPTKIRIFSVQGNTSFNIGDEMFVNLTSGKADYNLKIDKYIESRGLVKLYNDTGVVIKAIVTEK